MVKFTDDELEDIALEWSAGLGYAVLLHGSDIGPERPAAERHTTMKRS